MRSNLIEFCGKRYRAVLASRLPRHDDPDARMLGTTAGWNARCQPAGAAVSNNRAEWRSGMNASADDDLHLSAIADALCQAHKMDILGQMAGGLAHRFNNLLQGVMSAMNLMHSRIQPGNIPELDFLMGHAFTSVKGVGALTQRLLEFARPRCPEAQAVDINAVIVRMQDLLRCTLLPGFDLKIELAAGPMATMCDCHQLENTLLDLVINARDAMPDGGVLTVKTEYADLAVEHARLPLGRYAGICVRDTGIGMSPEALEQVFDPFYTTKTTGHRVGLGLPLAELFAERFQGHIGIESMIGRGTQVWLYLPSRPV